MANNNSFLGRGWSFPPTFDLDSNSIEMVSDETDINQSLHILLSTSLGERVMQPTYGCNLSNFQFEPLNVGLISYLEDLVERAILFFEPRIKLERLEVTPADSFDLIEGRFTIAVYYLIKNTNSRFNYVYDFYLREADRAI